MMAQIDHYEIKAQLNSKFPRHFLAHDRQRGHEVVLKLLPPAEAMAKLDFVRYYRKEADIVAPLDHAALPQLYESVFGNEQIYLVYAYVPGTRQLSQVLAAQGEPLPAEMVVRWALQICDVLAYLHSCQPHPVILADLKPDNILLDGNGRIHIVDFGIINQTPDGHNKNADKIGTEGYSPPEQYRGELCPASDVYALGATMHHLLTNLDPREFEPFSWAERPLRSYNPTVNDQLEIIINKALKSDPADRFASGEMMGIALEEL